MTGGTKNDVPAMAVLVMNIKETNNRLADDIVIFHDGISIKDQGLINRILPVRFVLYSFPGETDIFSSTVTDYFSTMVFCKYECFKLLAEYSKVMWTDYDVVIRSDISELMDECSTGIRLMPSPGANVKQHFLSSIKELDMSKYDLNKSANCMPLFVIHDSLEYMKMYDYCLKKTIELGKYLYLPEQAIVDLMLQDYGIKVTPIPAKVYAAHPNHDTITDDVKIIHAYGQPKFWNGLSNTIWNTRYKRWVKMGGSKYRTPQTYNYFKGIIKKILRFGIRCLTVKKRITNEIIVRRILRYYSLPRFLTARNAEIDKVLTFLEKNGFSVFPYDFINKYTASSINIFCSDRKDMLYAIYKEKKLYFKSDFDIDKAKSYMNELLIEQDIESPHSYLAEDFKPQLGSVIIDIGAAEGNFSLSQIESAKHIYIFEGDPTWVNALEETFKPYENKTTIINKYVSDIDGNNTITIDSYFNSTYLERYFVKIDVEGHEVHVLNGMTNLLKSNADLMISVCSYHRKRDEENITKRLKEYKLKIYIKRIYDIPLD